MQKIPTLFERNHEGDRLVRDEVTPGCEWVLAGEGRAMRKWDGTCCLIKDHILYRRHDAKKGRTPPRGFLPCQPEPDPVTGHWPGWVIVGTAPEDKYHREAFEYETGNGILVNDIKDGTYELCGPKINGNNEGFALHVLVKHDDQELMVSLDNPTFEDIKQFLLGIDIEGIVWHHPDGRMAKIKSKDFGIDWPRRRD